MFTLDPNYCSLFYPEGGTIKVFPKTFVLENDNFLKTQVATLYIAEACPEHVIGSYLQDLVRKEEPASDLVLAALEKEEELRLSEKVQEEFAEIEKTRIGYDWIDHVAKLQKVVAKTFVPEDQVLSFVKSMQQASGNQHWKKYNRAALGFNIVGQISPNVILKKSGKEMMLHDVLGPKTVLVASSYS